MVRDLIPLSLTPENNVKIVTSGHDFHRLNRLFSPDKHVIGWDVETTPRKDYFNRRCRLIQFGDQEEQVVIDLRKFVPDADTLFDCQGNYGRNLHKAPRLQELFEFLTPVLTSRDITKAGVNLGFEYLTMYWNFGIRSQGFFDCSIVERVIQAGAHSLKDFAFFGMEEMVARYFGWQVDKTLQESFDLESECTWEQYVYAALDTRLPLLLMEMQNRILTGQTVADCKDLQWLDPMVLGDNLVKVAQLENDAIGAFQDMHVHGENLDKQKWRERTRKKEEQLAELIKTRLDPVFLPLVGSKWDLPLPETYESLREAASGLKRVSPEESAILPRIREAKKAGNLELVAQLYLEKADLAAQRDKQYKTLMATAMEMQKRNTYVRGLAPKCQGEALVNYRSRDQVLELLNEMPEVKKARKNAPLTDLEDDTLEAYDDVPIINALRIKTKLGKEISTYGYAWTYEWVTGPSKDEGWLNPGDGRLHCQFNQYDAETGRSSSSQPNAQNLPKDKDLRACFIVDPPDESIRISNCCNAETVTHGIAIAYGGFFKGEPEGRWCESCKMPCQTHPEEYVMVTADMSGAELRILAELAKDPIWIEAYNLGQDVHCICCELIEADLWPQVAQPDCAFYKLNPDGTLQKKKCGCKVHNVIRDGMKPTNFGLPYGIGVSALAIQIKKSKQETKLLMAKHRETFPIIWNYLAESGYRAMTTRRSYDMFGRRRVFPMPTWERAIERAREDLEPQLLYSEDQQHRNITTFIANNNRKPNVRERWRLRHRDPSPEEVKEVQESLRLNAERQGKNHEIQGTNASIAKVAMGAGFAKDGTPYLWHTLPNYKAKLVKFVHDELVVQCPKRFGQQVADLIGKAFLAAGAEVMSLVRMEFEYHIAPYWCK